MNHRSQLLFALAVAGLCAQNFVEAPSLGAEELEQDVPALLSSRCVHCHGPGEAEAGLRLDARENATSTLDSGNAAIVPGDPIGSELLKRISDPDEPMPPEGERLSAGEIEQIRQWIADGADWKPHWAYRALSEPPVSTVDDLRFDAWIKTPIDAFILDELEQRGLRPSPPTDRRTLLRRVYYDLIGLPPTPEETKAFLSDDSTNAYQQIVDRLLASPRYGERWARHWMDVVHYADSHGFEHDIYRDSWPYRDYLIRSFNEDKPYARFVQEQVAGDVLFPEDPQALAATGFLATGPWDLSALQAGNPDSVDYLISQYLDRDDIVSTVMATFVSSTVECARCHDHKFDPISQADYYNLQAVFAGIDKATRLYDPDPEVANRRAELEASRAEIEAKRASKDGSLLEDGIQAESIRWVKSLPAWTVLDPISYESVNGATLESQPDGSLFSTGQRPQLDTYTVRVHTSLPSLTAIRLELLADDRLPSGGPGRQDNGNMHLNEFKISAAPLSDTSTSHPVAIHTARADFDQEGWEVGKSIDNLPGSAWGIHPAVGQSHSAVYVLEEPLSCEEGVELTFTLEQSHGNGHLIGRFRLAAIDVENPELLAIDTRLKAILDTSPGERTLDQLVELAASYLLWPIDNEISSLPEQQRLFCGTNRFLADRGHQPAKTPRPIHFLERGSIHSPGALAEPNAISCMPNLSSNLDINDSSDEGARRAALATWLADEKNVLTWRSIVNRVWHFHFGRGLVATPSDFGQMGARPSHPDLLDWLAVKLQGNGGSLKWLHRLIVTSNVYRQASHYQEEYVELDEENRYLWRMNRRPLDAESIRDSVLQHSGKLDLQMGGPPVKQFLETKVFGLRPEADYAGFDVDDPSCFRRSIYRYVYRTMPDPFMNAMDCPDASQRAPVRSNSITALQAAAMLNDPFLVRQCEHIADRIKGMNSESTGQIESLYWLIYGRRPGTEESAAVFQYAEKHGLANACRILLNTNEFLFVD